MKLRRRIAFPKAQLRDLAWQLQQEFATTGKGSGVTLHGSNFKPLILSLMSAMGQKRKLKRPPPDVRFTPESGHWGSAARCPLCAKSRHRTGVEMDLAEPLNAAKLFNSWGTPLNPVPTDTVDSMQQTAVNQQYRCSASFVTASQIHLVSITCAI
jgi:hypothetical protein